MEVEPRAITKINFCVVLGVYVGLGLVWHANNHCAVDKLVQLIQYLTADLL
jgi:hypothetical protein